MAEFVVNDQTNLDQFIQDRSGLCGCKHPDEYVGPVCASAPDDQDLIPWSEFPDRISDMTKSKTSLVDVWEKSPIGKPYQSFTNWCWCWCAVDGLMVEREAMGLPFARLSPSSVAGPIMNFANVGGWPEQALDWLIKNGVATTQYVPDVTTNPRAFKDGWKEDAAKYKVTGFEAIGKNKQRQISKLLQRKPLSCAFMFMSHAMCVLSVTDDNPRLRYDDPNRYGFRVLNSWKDGIIKLEGSRAFADSAYATTQASFVGDAK